MIRRNWSFWMLQTSNFLTMSNGLNSSPTNQPFGAVQVHIVHIEPLYRPLLFIRRSVHSTLHFPTYCLTTMKFAKYCCCRISISPVRKDTYRNCVALILFFKSIWVIQGRNTICFTTTENEKLNNLRTIIKKQINKDIAVTVAYPLKNFQVSLPT